MKNRFSNNSLLCIIVFLFTAFQSTAQIPGFINRQATSIAGRAVLDPNSDGYTSATTAGFGNDDVANAELSYYPIEAYPVEPYSDLRRGPNHSFSDFVPDTAGNSIYYRFSAGQQVMFRMRLGSVTSGSKGYSILMDTDGKFGAAGPNADPNYLPATTGTNGNPGFEIEIVLETNFRIAIYNVDGTSSPVLVKQYTNWQDMSQVSIASTNDNGDPDFLIDFYIPFSDLQAPPFNLTTASSIRMTATTVMAPKAAIGGPASDIYGVPGYTYDDFIIAQPACNIFNNPVICPTAMCTAAPNVNSPISTGTVNIIGTWTKSVLTGAAGTANITVYKNGLSIGTVLNVSSGAGWSLNSITLINGDVITAKALAAAPAVESMCLNSNAVAASTCNSSNRPPAPVLTCNSGSKGLDGTNLSTGWTVHVDNLTRSVFDNSVTNATGLFGAQTGTSPNIVWPFSGGCSSGAPLASGSYKVYYTNNVTGCNSLPAYFCAAGNGGSALAGSLTVPAITTPVNAVFTIATTSITGTTDANATLYLYVSGTNLQTTTATAGGAFTFSGLSLINGQQLYIVAELNTGTIGTSKCASQTILYTVSCFTKPPIITTDNNNQLTAGAAIIGTSEEPAGATIKIYTSTNVLVATTAVQANGSWSTGNAGTTPSVYNAVAATSYYANAQNGSCGVSANSATYTAASATAAARCGSITGPVGAGAATVSGTLTGSFTTTTINLYLDGELIGSSATNNTAWGPVTVNTTALNTLYSNGVLKIGVQESGKQEVACPTSAQTILCTPSPAVPLYTLSSSSVNQYQNITCTISNAATGTFYALSDSATGQSFGQGKWATTNGSLVLTTDAFTSAGIYKVKVNATSLTGVTVCNAVSATTTLVVNSSPLPLSLIEFSGKKESGNILLQWVTENEIQSNLFYVERSSNGITFYPIGLVNAKGINGSRNTYSFPDVNPFTGINYYRLKMLDVDGKYAYSNTVILMTNLAAIVNNVSPNPFTEKINVTVHLNKATSIYLTLLDLAGRIIFTKYVTGQQGSNLIEWKGMQMLGEGIYYLKIHTPEAHTVQKILKIR